MFWRLSSCPTGYRTVYGNLISESGQKTGRKVSNDFGVISWRQGEGEGAPHQRPCAAMVQCGLLCCGGKASGPIRRGAGVQESNTFLLAATSHGKGGGPGPLMGRREAGDRKGGRTEGSQGQEPLGGFEMGV